MKPSSLLLLLTALALPGFARAEEDDKPVKFADLPAAVAKAIKAAAGEAKLAAIMLGDEDGVEAYETTWEAGGHKHEIAVAKDGKVLSSEEIIPLAEAPAAIQKAITAEAGANKVTEVEKVLEGGETFFECTIEFANPGKGQKRLGVKFNAAGKVLEREDPDAEKDEKDEKGEKNEKDEKDEKGEKGEKSEKKEKK